MLEDLRNIIQTCNRKEINNLQIRYMITYLAQNFKTLVPEIEKKQKIVSPTSEECSFLKTYVDQQIEIVREFIVKKMSTIDILDIKVQKLTNAIQQEFREKVTSIDKNSKVLEQVLTDEVTNKKANDDAMKKQLESFNQKIKDYDSKIQKQLTRKLKDNVKAIQIQNQKKIKDLNQKIKQNQDNWKKIFKVIEEQKTRSTTPVPIFTTAGFLGQEGQAKMENIMPSPVLLNEWIDLESPNQHLLKLEGNKITTLNEASMFGKKKIKNRSVFYVKVEKMASWMSIGIIDSKCKIKEVLVNQQNWISYCSSGRLYNGKERKYQGDGFKLGEIVKVSIDPFNRTIEWSVDNQTRHKLWNMAIGDGSIDWVPYIYFNSQQDSASINQ